MYVAKVYAQLLDSPIPVRTNLNAAACNTRKRYAFSVVEAERSFSVPAWQYCIERL